MARNGKNPWKDGYYLNKNHTPMVLKVDGQNCVIRQMVSFDFPDKNSTNNFPTYGGIWTYGDFGSACKEVELASGGIKNYNIELSYMEGKRKGFGVVTEDGENIYTFGFSKESNHLKWLSDDDFMRFLESRDPMEAPSCPYKIQPENEGKLVWLSGPPGAGKSTTGQLFAKKANYVYYEVDCLNSYLNPFVPLDVDEPTKAAFRQKPVKVTSKEFMDGIIIPKSTEEKYVQGKIGEITPEEIKPFFETMSKEIDRQRKRIGGNFVVAFATQTQVQRDLIRQILPDCTFITLTLTREAQKKRLLARHDEKAEADVIKFLTNIYDFYELPGENECNTYNLDITDEMTRDEIVKSVEEILKNA